MVIELSKYMLIRSNIAELDYRERLILEGGGLGNPKIEGGQRKLIKGRRQNSLPLSTNFSQNVTEPYKGISYPVSDLCRRFRKLTWSSAYISHVFVMRNFDISPDLAAKFKEAVPPGP